MRTFSAEAAHSFSYLASFSMKVNSKSKDFSPLGANSFVEESVSIREGCVVTEAKKQLKKVIFL